MRTIPSHAYGSLIESTAALMLAGYLPRSQWDCRVASALALEKVGMAMAAPGLRSCLFGEDHETTRACRSCAHHRG